MEFIISDTGMGIKKADFAHLFNAYEQMDSNNNRKIIGTGLGLAITKTLANLMGGDVTVESEYHVGSTFTVTLPFVAGNPENADKSNTEFTYIKVRDAQVLLVDDIESNLTVGLGLLRLSGINADTAMSGAEAIAAVKKKDYDIVFMDHMMPEMDGVKTMHNIRKLGEKYQRLPIIALTANAIVESRNYLLGMGMNDFISKPIDREELTGMLLKWLPADKIVSMDKEKAKPEQGWSPVLEEAAKIKGLYIKDALERLGGRQETLEALLEQDAESFREMMEKARTYLEEEKIKDFSILVHGMKSALASIGATQYSETAAFLETASKREDIAFCYEKFPVFYEGVLDLARQMAMLFPGEKQAAKPQMDLTIIQEKLKKIVNLLDDYEVEEAQMNMDEVMKFSFGAEADRRLRIAGTKMSRFEYDEAAAALKELLASLGENGV